MAFSNDSVPSASLQNVSGANAPRRAQEAGPYDDSATTTMTRWEEVYTSICEHQGCPMYSPLKIWEHEEAELSMSPCVSG